MNQNLKYYNIGKNKSCVLSQLWWDAASDLSRYQAVAAQEAVQRL